MGAIYIFTLSLSFLSHLLFLHSKAVLIDMEDGVVNQILQGPLGDVFDNRQLITDVYGSGNNWYEIENNFNFFHESLQSSVFEDTSIKQWHRNRETLSRIIPFLYYSSIYFFYLFL